MMIRIYRYAHGDAEERSPVLRLKLGMPKSGVDKTGHVGNRRVHIWTYEMHGEEHPCLKPRMCLIYAF